MSIPGGSDIIIEYPGVLRACGGLDLAVRCVLSYWPTAVIQGADGARFTSYASIAFDVLSELFIYRDVAALESWTKLGADTANANTMLHFVAGDEALTVVVDDAADATMKNIVATLRDLLTGAQAAVRTA